MRRTAWPAYQICFDFVTIIIFGEEYELCSSHYVIFYVMPLNRREFVDTRSSAEVGPRVAEGPRVSELTKN
jgi:hypothetical protein